MFLEVESGGPKQGSEGVGSVEKEAKTLLGFLRWRRCEN